MHLNTVAIIPLRGSDPEAQMTPESLLCGKPVLTYTIEAARQATCLDRILVSTDSAVVAEVARGYGTEVPFFRPPHLAAAGVPMIQVLQHCLQWLEQEDSYPVDIVVLLEVTHPIRPPGLIDDVVEVLQTEGLDTVFAAREERHRFWRFSENSLEQLHPEEGDHTRHQVQPTYKELAGMATAIRADIVRSGRRLGDRIGLVPVRDVSSQVDLHDEDGLRLAQALLQLCGSGEYSR